MKHLIALGAAALLVLTAPGATAADIDAGKKKVTEICQACHGMHGNGKTDTDPRLAGQYVDYIIKALQDYASGARKNPIMAGIAGTLSPEDRANVAAYYASQKDGVMTVHATK